MRRRAEELGIRYSPMPPYEVLETREITADELQTARQLSRLLDGFYNTPAWQGITRQLIVDHEDFLHKMLDYLIELRVIDQPWDWNDGVSFFANSARSIIRLYLCGQPGMDRSRNVIEETTG